MILYAEQRPGFEGYNARYAAKDPLFSDPADANKVFIERLIRFYAHEADFSLLDIGCGQGYFTTFMREAVEQHAKGSAPPRVVGMDGAGVAISQAERRDPKTRWINDTLQHFLKDHGSRFPEQTYDMVVDRGGTTVVESEDEAEEIVKAVKDLLRPDGMYVFLSARSWYAGGGTVKPPHLTWTRDWMQVVGSVFPYVLDGSDGGFHQKAYLK